MQVALANQQQPPQHRPNRLRRTQPQRNLRSSSAPPPDRAPDPRRQRSKQIANGTIDALQKGYYDAPDLEKNRVLRYDISADIRHTEGHTEFFPNDSIELRRWKTVQQPHSQNARPLKISFLRFSTLEGARYLKHTTSPRVGILNFASATRPGGGFLTGATAQEESIARSSSLYASLATPTANLFYDSHIRDERGGFYSHAMIYSPNVLLFRTDDGSWLKPIRVDIVTSPAVNAKEVRGRARGGSEHEERIYEVMKERMARILRLFELRGVRNIVLGSFGTGVFQNDIGMVAGIWRELLNSPQARYTDSFDQVVFAIPDKKTLDTFQHGFL